MSQKITMTKRYYSTSSAVNYPPLLVTLGEALNDAEKKLTEKGLEEIYIVEVVKIVRRVKNPSVEIIDVRR